MNNIEDSMNKNSNKACRREWLVGLVAEYVEKNPSRREICTERVLTLGKEAGLSVARGDACQVLRAMDFEQHNAPYDNDWSYPVCLIRLGDRISEARREVRLATEDIAIKAKDRMATIHAAEIEDYERRQSG